MIISPYRAQVNLVKRELTKHSLAGNIKVDTVDAFQGKEAGERYSGSVSNFIDCPSFSQHFLFLQDVVLLTLVCTQSAGFTDK